MQKSNISLRYFILMILTAFAFSVLARLFLVIDLPNHPERVWNDQPLISSVDGYFWAEGARDIIDGDFQKNEHNALDFSISKLTAFLVKTLPFSFEAIIFYMPIFFGSLIVIPLLLIARAINREYAGFLAAIFASIAWSYYNRTTAGIYDTDMLMIVLMTFVVYSFIAVTTYKKEVYLLLIPIFIELFGWWYLKSLPLIVSIAAMYLLYTLIFDKKNIFNYKVLLIAAVYFFPISIFLKLIIYIILYFLFLILKSKTDKFIIPLFIAAVLISFTSKEFQNGFLYLFNYYIVTKLFAAGIDTKLQFYHVLNTIGETQSISIRTLGERISGHIITLIISLAGYILLAIRYPVMTIAAPMLLIGLFSFQLGARFTAYASLFQNPD